MSKLVIKQTLKENGVSRPSYVGVVSAGYRNEKGYPTSDGCFHIKPSADNPVANEIFRRASEAAGKMPELVVFFNPTYLAKSSFTLRFQDTANKLIARFDGVEMTLFVKGQDQPKVSKFIEGSETYERYNGNVEAFLTNIVEWAKEHWAIPEKQLKTFGFKSEHQFEFSLYQPSHFPTGTYMFRTQSDHSAINITGAVDSIIAQLESPAVIGHIPFVLSAKKVTSGKAGVSTSFPIVSCLCAYDNQAILNAQQRFLEGASKAGALAYNQTIQLTN